MNKRMRGRTSAADHRKTHLGAMLLFMFTLAALIAAALIRPAMRTDKPDGDELTNIEIVLDHVDADEGVSRRVLLELMKADIIQFCLQGRRHFVAPIIQEHGQQR